MDWLAGQFCGRIDRRIRRRRASEFRLPNLVLISTTAEADIRGED
jgi:hypothetical protein